MKQLILMRHAKSDWRDPSLQDHDRPLAKRGRRAAAALGDWLRGQGLTPDEILCSTATRAQETCARLALSCAPTLCAALYLAEPDTMQTVLRRARGDTVLMIGHNPGIAIFATTLLAASPGHARFGDYPTGATVVARFDIARWQDLRAGTGHATGFVVPRDLTHTP